MTGDSTAVRIPFARTADRLTADVWTAGIVVEATHRIVTTLTFSDGHHITTIADVTDLLRDFNTDKLTPLDVTGSLLRPRGSRAERNDHRLDLGQRQGRRRGCEYVTE